MMNELADVFEVLSRGSVLSTAADSLRLARGDVLEFGCDGQKLMASVFRVDLSAWQWISKSARLRDSAIHDRRQTKAKAIITFLVLSSKSHLPQQPTTMGRGQLVFKKKSKTKHTLDSHDGSSTSKLQHRGPTSIESSSTSAAGRASLAATAEPQQQEAMMVPQILTGTGKISSSGTVVTGYGTLFEKELSVGDAILIGAGTPEQEMRVVTMRLSNISLNLSSAFSNNIKTPTEFSYIHKPRDKQKEARLAAKKQQLDQRHEKEHTLGTYVGDRGEVVYREKTEHGSYRIKKDKLDGEVTRSDLLDIRAKRASDKYC